MIPTEAQESRLFMRAMKIRGYKFTHIKNETGRSHGGRRVRNYRAMWDAVDGVSKGFPDFLVVAKNKVIVVEMKRIKGSSTSPEQKSWLEALNAAGIPSAVCKGAAEAIAFVEAVVS